MKPPTTMNAAKGMNIRENMVFTSTTSHANIAMPTPPVTLMIVIITAPKTCPNLENQIQRTKRTGYRFKGLFD